MANTGDGTSWDIASPAHTAQASNGALEIRDLRRGVETRINKEHVTLATSSVGGEHLCGSAVAYYQASAPTGLPSNSAALANNTISHTGRLWINSSDKSLKVWTGTTWAYNVIVDSTQLGSNVVTGASVSAAAIGTTQLAALSVTTAKLADTAVTTAKITDANVTTAKIADLNVTTGKIADGNVTLAKLATDSVSTIKIVDANVTTAKLSDSAVTTAKINDGAVTAAKLGSDAVTTVKILDANVTAAKLASDAVTTAKILDANVTTAKLADGAVTNDKLAGNSKQTLSSWTGNGTSTGPTINCGFQFITGYIIDITSGKMYFFARNLRTVFPTDASTDISNAISAWTTGDTSFSVTTASGINVSGHTYYAVIFG